MALRHHRRRRAAMAAAHHPRLTHKVAVAATAAAAVAAAAVASGATPANASPASSVSTLLQPLARTLRPQDVATNYTLQNIFCGDESDYDHDDEEVVRHQVDGKCDESDDDVVVLRPPAVSLQPTPPPSSAAAAANVEDDRNGGARARAAGPGGPIGSAACPTALAFSTVNDLGGGSYGVPDASVVDGGDPCTGPATLVFVTPARLGDVDRIVNELSASAGREAAKKVLKRLAASGVATEAENGFPDNVLIGLEAGGRMCGGRRSTADVVTVIAEMRKAGSVKFLGRALMVPAGNVLIRFRLPANQVVANERALCAYTSGPGTITRDIGTGGPKPKSNTTNEEATCFPGTATVELASGATVPMARLAVGDVVRVASGDDAAAFSPVYLFSHRTPDAGGQYVAATTASGRTLVATADHLVPLATDGHPLVRLGDVVVGDALTDAVAATSSRVVAVAAVGGAGLYAPHTVHGDIVVGGVVASTWTAAVEPTVARTLLRPFAAAAAAVGYRVDVSGGLLEGGGGGGVLGGLLRALQWVSGY